jgi:hypothetical protein
MTRTVPFSRAVQHLGLEHSEVMTLIGLIGEERGKMKKYADALMQQLDTPEIPSSEELLALTPVTDGITAREVRRSRTFLQSLGINSLAASLGF